MIKMAWLSAAIAMLGVASTAQAFDIDVGNDNVTVNLTVDMRYSVGVRAEKMNPAIGNNPMYDQSEYRYPNTGDVVTNRIDVTPQITLGYNPESGPVSAFGIRSSAYAFRDVAYNSGKEYCRPGSAPPGLPPALGGNDGFLGKLLANLGALTDKRLSYCNPAALSYSAGKPNQEALDQHYQGIELLDLFGYVNFELLERPISLKVGRHAMFWGEATLNPTLGVAYAMGPVDLNKALSVPGASIQDIFLPVNQISSSISLSDSLTLGMQYFLGWEGIRSPEGGSYLAANDNTLHAPDSFYVGNMPSQFITGIGTTAGALRFPRRTVFGGDNDGNFGVQLKWSPDFMSGGSLGLYYRKFDEINPWLSFAPARLEQNPGFMAMLLRLQGLPGVGNLLSGALPDPLPGAYQYAYAKDTELFGLSLSRQLLGISWGLDLAYSRNRALNSQIFRASEDGQGARGDTLSGVLSAIRLGGPLKFLGGTVWDASSLVAELNGSRLLKVTSNEGVYKKVDTEACRADMKAFGVPGGSLWSASNPNGLKGETIDGCSSDYALGANVVFTPTWYQVFPGIDLSLGLAYSTGLKNNSPITSGGNERLEIGSATLNATLYNKVSAALSYRYYGSIFRTGTNIAGEPMMTSYNGTGSALADRDWVSMSLKYSF